MVRWDFFLCFAPLAICGYYSLSWPSVSGWFIMPLNKLHYPEGTVWCSSVPALACLHFSISRCSKQRHIKHTLFRAPGSTSTQREHRQSQWNSRASRVQSCSTRTQRSFTCVTYSERGDATVLWNISANTRSWEPLCLMTPVQHTLKLQRPLCSLLIEMVNMRHCHIFLMQKSAISPCICNSL